MTQQYILRAMAKNYAGGHSWDHLDGEACMKAAEEIARLRDALEKIRKAYVTAPGMAAPTPTTELVWTMYKAAGDALVPNGEQR